MDRIVVIGAGQAGAAAAAGLRAGGYSGALTLVGDEGSAPYQRPPLSKKYLLGEIGAERLLLKAPEFYADAGIELLTGTPVHAIDRAAREVVLADRRLPYDAAILATGAVPRRLPAAIGGDLAGVFVLRDLADADALAPEILPGRRVLVVGGGYIGLEAAAVCAQKGMAVTVIEAAPRILGRVACAETAGFVADLHRRHGVELLEGIGLARLEGSGGRLTGAVLADGREMAFDLAIVGIGVAPRTALAEAAGLAIDNGIAVDGCCRTSDPAILAAGDCASFPGTSGRMRLESVQNAIDMAEHAAASLLGGTAAYAPVPWFWSDQYDARLQIAGLGTGADRIVSRPGSRPGGQSFWYFRGDRLLAVDAVTDPRAYMQGKRWIEAGHSPDPDRLADPAIDFKALA